MQHSKAIGRSLTGAIFIIAGLNHFLQPRLYRAIMPPYLPWHGPLVAISGLAEVVLGVLVCVPRSAQLGGWGLIALLVAVFPANLHMALNPERFAPLPAWALWARLPLQPLLMAWVHWCTRRG
ncbi:MAG: DoxX family protein [Chloroflexales bacterium]|nr:DoxX family protein [Chloroflexales bacterium]